MELSRNRQHEIIMTVIYDELTDFTYDKENADRNAFELLASLCECSIEEVDPFMKDSISASLQCYGEASNAVIPYLTGWTWERIPLITRSIIVMSYAHYYKVEKIDKKIVINIAVELTKKYVEEKQAAFVNGILEKVLK